MFFLLTLPFRIAFGVFFGLLFLPFAILFLPFLLLRILIKATVALVMLPIALLFAGLGLAIAFFAISFAVLIPLLPAVFLAACVWLVVRLVSRPALSPLR